LAGNDGGDFDGTGFDIRVQDFRASLPEAPEDTMRYKSEAGQAVIFTAIAMVALMGFAGLAVDMGVMRYEKRTQQSAADGAAIAGADEIRYGGGAGIDSAALNAASANAFTDNNGGAACTDSSTVGCIGVVVNHPPVTGPHTGQANYVEVLVTAEQRNYFMTLLGRQKTTVTARAVATLIGENGTAPGCVYTLGPPGVGVGVDVVGTPTLKAPTCGIEDNGNFTTSGAKLNVSAGSIGVVGTDTNNGGGTVTCTAAGPCPVNGIPAVGDPLSFEPAPGVNAPGVNFNPAKSPVPGTTYKSITINNTQVVNFPAGTYVVNGSLTINAGATVCNQTGAGCAVGGADNAGVTFYITNGGTVKINGGADVELSAPNSGTYAGILFYQDPLDTSKAIIDGNSNSYYQGALYFPGAELDFGGTSLTNAKAAYTLVVADSLKVNGTATLNLDSNYSTLPGGVSIIENARLVE
jgi:hypothetical protein